jgi:hypothetical protein
VSAGVVAQCPACRALVVVGAVVVDGSRGVDGAPRAGLACGACGAVSWLPLTTTVVTSSPPALTALPPPSLPILPAATVVADGPAATATPAPAPMPAATTTTTTTTATTAPSALATATFDEDTVARVRARFAAPTETQTHLAERFDALLATKWAVESEHKAILKTAAAAGELAFVGGRYRAVLDVVRDEPRARAAQNELLTMAMATMSSQRLAPSEEGTSRTKVALAIILFLVVGGGLFWVVRTVMATLAQGGAGGLD